MLDRCLPSIRSIINSNRHIIPRVMRDDGGVTAIEYALIAALIAVAAIAAFSLVGTNLSNTFSLVASKL